jgi:hypothetical protein
MQKPFNIKSPIFILGIQRSGTTWLANIFDSSPDVLLFMEPFSVPYNIFPEFPESSFFLDHSSNSLDNLLQVEMPSRMLKYKSLFLKHSMVDPNLFRLEHGLVSLINRMGRFGPIGLVNRTKKFELLNLNRTDKNYPIIKKNNNPSFWAIKELRLAGKIPLLISAFPKAKFIVIMRHPCATVLSILRWFDKGRLIELLQDLETYLEKIEVQKISNSYQQLISRCKSGSLAHKVALYWRISYETMFKQLENKASVQFVTYEQVAIGTQEACMQIFSRLEIPWSSSIEDYISFSTNKEIEKPEAITTLRNSATYYRDWQARISEATQHAVSEMTDDSFLMPFFKPYY